MISYNCPNLFVNDLQSNKKGCFSATFFIFIIYNNFYILYKYKLLIQNRMNFLGRFRQIIFFQYFSQGKDYVRLVR